jgi:hypothetical protein
MLFNLRTICAIFYQTLTFEKTIQWAGGYTCNDSQHDQWKFEI